MKQQATQMRLLQILPRKVFKPKAVDSLLRALGIVLASVTLISTMAVTDPGARFNDLGHRMMCTCTCNQVLLECNHVGCPVSGGMRNELQAAIDRGDNDDLVLAAFVQKYGAIVLAAPTTTGFSRIAWIMPFLVLTLGLGATVLIVRRWRHRTLPMPAVPVPDVPNTPAFERRRSMIRRDTDL